MKLSEKQLSMIYLNLCEEMTGKSRKLINMEFLRNNLKTYLPKDIETYLRNRIEEIPDRKEDPFKGIELEPLSKVEATSILDELRAKTAGIIDGSKPVDEVKPVAKPTSGMINGVYVPPTDKYGFFEE